MRFRYITRDGTERTVETAAGLADAIRGGQLRRDQQLFDSAIGRWMAAGEHESLTAAFALLDDVTPAPAAHDLKSAAPTTGNDVLASANRRIVARFLDSWIIGLPFVFAVSILSVVLIGPVEASIDPVSSDLRTNNAFWALVAWFGVMLLDPVSTVMWGGSPGKLVLGMRVRSSDGSPLSWPQAWQRSLLMWVRGLAFGFPLIQLVTAAVAMRRVSRSGRSSWDIAANTIVVRVK